MSKETFYPCLSSNLHPICVTFFSFREICTDFRVLIVVVVEFGRRLQRLLLFVSPAFRVAVISAYECRKVRFAFSKLL